VLKIDFINFSATFVFTVWINCLLWFRWRPVLEVIAHIGSIPQISKNISSWQVLSLKCQVPRNVVIGVNFSAFEFCLTLFTLFTFMYFEFIFILSELINSQANTKKTQFQHTDCFDVIWKL